jgi:N-acetylmuramoyl-L-alanine amidase
MIVRRVPVDVPGLSVEVWTRPDVPDGLSTLIQDLNRSGVDGVISLHFNATGSDAPSPDRAYSCVYPGATKAARMASLIGKMGWGGIPRREPVTRPDLAILSDTEMPVVLDEPCYLDLREHRAKLIRGLDTLAMQYRNQILAIYEERFLSDGKDRARAGG